MQVFTQNAYGLEQVENKIVRAKENALSRLLNIEKSSMVLERYKNNSLLKFQDTPEWESVKNKIKILVDESRELVFETVDSVVLEYHQRWDRLEPIQLNLGKFKFVVECKDIEVYGSSLNPIIHHPNIIVCGSRPSYRGKPYDHPHVRSGIPCFGNLDTRAEFYLSPVKFFASMLNFLQSVHIGGEFYHLGNWLWIAGRCLNCIQDFEECTCKRCEVCGVSKSGCLCETLKYYKEHPELDHSAFDKYYAWKETADLSSKLEDIFEEDEDEEEEE